MSAVWDLDLAAGEKLVLLALADQANDEGRQCWPSVATIAKRSGQGERTVRRILRALEKKGHLTAKHRDGASSQYHVHPGQNGTPAKSAPLPNKTDTPAKMAPKTPRTIIKKTKSAHEHEMPAGWVPTQFGPKSQSRATVDGWPPGELKIQLERFAAHHRSRGNKFKDWQEAWSTWVLNSRKFGGGNGSNHQNRQANEPVNPMVRAVARRKAERAACELSGDGIGTGHWPEDGGDAAGLPERWD